MTTTQLRRLIRSLDNGVWGDEPLGDGSDTRCVRAADFNFTALRATVENAPFRQIGAAHKRRLLLERDDLVLEKSGGGEKQSVGRAVLYDSDTPAVCSNFAARLRTRPGIAPAYLNYLLASLYFDGATTRCVLQTTGIQNLDTDAWLQTEVRDLDIGEQQRIADFLDDQVARIDNIIAARQKQAALATDTRLSVASALLGLNDGPQAPLSAVAMIVDTEHKTAPSSPGGGHWMAGTSSVRHGEIVQSALRETDRATYQEWTRRGVPAPGDLLLTREAPVGEVALLRADNQRVAIGQRVVLVRPLPGWRPAFLRLVLMSPVIDELVVNAIQGSLHPHLNMADIARLRVPVRDQATQQRQADAFDAHLTSIESALRLLQSAVDDLHEFKRSLITAAVTGEFDVSTADGSRVLA